MIFLSNLLIKNIAKLYKKNPVSSYGGNRIFLYVEDLKKSDSLRNLIFGLFTIN